MTPLNGEGVLQQTPTPKLTGLPQSNSSFALRQACMHGTVLVEQTPPGYLHHALERCALCGAHLRWLPRPSTIQRRRLNAFRLARLLMCDRLTSWERSFVRDVSKNAKLSPRQQSVADRLASQYLEARS
jgi:hypothetical protein